MESPTMVHVISSRNQMVQVYGFTYSRPPTSSAPGLLRFLLHVNDAFNIVSDGVPSLFTGDIKFVYVLQSVALGSVISKIKT